MRRTETHGQYQVTAFGYKAYSRIVSDERLRVFFFWGGGNPRLLSYIKRSFSFFTNRLIKDNSPNGASKEPKNPLHAKILRFF